MGERANIQIYNEDCKRYVYIVTDHLIICGCFDTKQKAIKYIDDSPRLFIERLEVL